MRGVGPLKPGDRVLARTEETERGWQAHPMKKLPSSVEGIMGVVEIDGAGKGWLARSTSASAMQPPSAIWAAPRQGNW
jgi:ribonuclease R